MIEVAQLEEPVITTLHDAPSLLVEWSPRWEEFVTSIRPALARSTAHLAGETPFGIFPYREMLAAMATEAFLIFAIIAIRIKIDELRPYIAPKLPSHEIIYYSGDELPRTEDLAGSQAGVSGHAGGEQAHHRTQTIKVARGNSLTPKVVDAPNLKIPASRDPVANLLAVRPDPGPPPVEGTGASRNAPVLRTAIVAPAPGVIRDVTRNAISVTTVIPPAPTISRDLPLAVPALNSAIVPPAPAVARDRGLVAPALAPTVTAPAPSVSRERSRSTPSLAANIIPPAPEAVSPQDSRAPVQMTHAVIAPPVSSPERESLRNPKLAMPAPAVVAPPPSNDISQDVHRAAGVGIPDPSKAVVPPPPAPSSGGSLVGSIFGKLFGSTEVVPPPSAPAASSVTSGDRNGNRTALTPTVVPPPTMTAGNDAHNRSGASAISAKVVPPPPTVSGSSASGTHGNGTVLASNVVPPPPSINRDAGVSGSGRGATGAGLGRAMDIGSTVAPPANGGSGNGPAAIVSPHPGPKVGLPNDTNSGVLAMSPTGGAKPGIGSGGGGKGIGRGDGPGAAMTGENSGAAKSGTERGSSPDAHGGISPTSGSGGAGNAANGNPPVPGVSVTGGTSMVTLPSFGDNSASNTTAPLPGRSTSHKQPQAFDITVVASSTSGGAFEAYKNWLPGGEKYTRYLDTSAGRVVMEFSDPASAAHPHAGALIGPQAIRTDLPEGLPHSRLVIACILDASGNLKNLRVLEPGPGDMNAKILAALPSWKFEAAMAGTQPVEINAILGFNIDTNDR